MINNKITDQTSKFCRKKKLGKLNLKNNKVVCFKFFYF